MKEQIIQADHILTMNPENDVIRDGAVHISSDGRILAVGRAKEILDLNPEVSVKNMGNHLLMPGLVNVHAHSGLLRGTAEGLPVWEWLQKFIDPMHRVLNKREAELASYLCYAESLLSGATTVVDMWRYMEGSAQAADQLGNRALLVPYVAEHPDHDYFETLDSNENLLKRWHLGANGRVQVWVGMEHMFYAVPEAWKRAIEMAKDYNTGFHTHSNESQFDGEEAQRRYQLRPIEALEKFGLLEAPKTLLAHCVWLNDKEIKILADRGIGVAHNPVSNMKLASGAARVTDFLASGIPVGLGTDGEKENNNFDMFEEMKAASLLAKVTQLDASALDAWSVCRMATIGGAKAIGLQDQIGSLEPGKQADLIAIRTDIPRLTPLIPGKDGNLHHNLVHAVRGGDVEMTMVGGKILVENKQLLTANIKEIITQVNAAVPDLFHRRSEYLAQHTPVNELESQS